MIAYPLSAAGVVTHVLDAGPRDGRPVILVHGLGARADRWSQTVEALGAAGLRVVAFDLPGHGFAAKPDDFDYSTAGYAAYLVAVMDELGIERAVLVGTSLGGHVVATVAAEHPDRVAGLGLVAAVGLLPWPDDRRQATAGRATELSRAGVEAKLRILLHDQDAVTPELIEEEWRINNSPGATQAFDQLAAYVLDEIEDHLMLDAVVARSDQLPVLLVWGEHDQSVPVETLAGLAELLPRATVLRVADAGHAPHAEQPEVVNRALLDLVERSW